jgi:hypothetical protein
VGLDSTPDGKGLWVATSGRVHPPSTAGAAGPHSFVFVDSGGRVGRWNPCTTITWRFNPAFAPPGGQELVADAFDYVASITGLRFRYGGTTSAAPAPTLRDAVIVGWVPFLEPAGQASPVAIGTAAGPRIVAAGIELDAALPIPTTWSHGGWGPIVLHEIGHVLGLGHVTDPTQLMFTYNHEDSPTTFASGDLAGLHPLSAAAGCP